ncbi:MAG: hypothetical protein FWH40_01530 [Coriobacteriia bacterium]|nr:hypothetical protein [Coriobacteriia bacterium]
MLFRINNHQARYDAKADSLVFWCSGVDEHDDALAAVFDAFLLDLSEERQTFIRSYRLPEQFEQELFGSAAIQEKAANQIDKYKASYFFLSKARLDSRHLSAATELYLFFCDSSMRWEDFLATSTSKAIELVDSGLASALFASVDQGADFWFFGDKTIENRAMQLLDGLAAFGYEVKPAYNLHL